ncbi:YciI family protein [Rothia sp. CCM 9416]|uniref:YciI family protein n=1 Tax=Rothia sp. CCM 9416 TaxID=3402655 RepID=UPI003AE93D4C
MAVYAVQYSYGSAEVQAEHRPAHRQYLAQLHEQGKLYVSGPLVDDPAGALLIFEVQNRQELDQLVAADPMHSGGAVTGHTVREWNPVIGKLG